MKNKDLQTAINRIWKKKKRSTFHFYFILFVAIILVIAVALASVFADLTGTLFPESYDNSVIALLVLVFYAIVIGVILSVFVGYFLLAPIKKLQNAMNKVADGDFEVSVMGESRFDEIDDLNHAFNLMMKQLRSTETLQSDFIANASHEFKTPLNAIEGYATLLKEEDLTAEEKQKYIENILLSSRKANELIANVLLLSKIDNQAIETKQSAFSASEQIRQAIVLQEANWAKKDISFDVDLDEITIKGNSSLTNHLWGNLIGNAIKFSPQKGEIKITFKRNASAIVFTVQDQGVGIKEEEKKYLYNKFYQGDTSHKAEGNGLGLALVKKIVSLYGGSVSAENAQGGGALFKVEFPLSVLSK